MAAMWISQALKHPGSLRAAARRRGMIKGTEKLSPGDLDRLHSSYAKTGNTKGLRRVNLARTLKKFKRK